MKTPSLAEPAFPAEVRELLRLLRIAIGTEQAGGPVGDTDPPFHWDAFDAAVTRHRIASFLLKRVPAPVLALLPDASARHVTTLGTVTRQRAHARAALLRTLTKELDDYGIPAISVKGPLLAEALYGAVGDRQAGDLDLLIDPADVDRLEVFMKASGRLRKTPGFELTPAQETLYRRLRHEYGYFDPASNVRVEVMWRLGSPDLARQAMREPLRDTVLDGHPIRMLGAETETLYLFDHGTRHGWFRLFWLVDIAVLVTTGQTNWDRIAARAREVGLSRSVSQGLVLAHELLNVPLPLAFAGPPSRAVRRLVSDGYWHLVRPEAESTVQQPLWRARYNLRRHDRWRTWFDEIHSMYLFPLVARDAGIAARWPWLFLLARPWLWAARRLLRRSRPHPRGHAPDQG